MSKKDEMVDGAPRGLYKYHPRLNGVDFYGEETGHFRSSGRQIWKLIKLLHGVIGPISTLNNDYLNTVCDDAVSLHETMPSHGSTGKVSTCCPSTEYTCFTFDWRGWVIFQIKKNYRLGTKTSQSGPIIIFLL